MTQMLESPGMEGLYLDSPILTQETALAKFNVWQAGMPVSSELTPVGYMVPSEDDTIFLGGRRILGAEYADIQRQSPFWQATARLRHTFMSLVMADVERCGLQGTMRSVAFAGHYRGIHREVLHTDNYRHPSVRWTLAWGVGSTVGATGQVSQQNVMVTGDLRPDVEVGLGGQLEIETHESGTLLRFMNIADIHGGPAGEGARMMAQATLDLERRPL